MHKAGDGWGRPNGWVLGEISGGSIWIGGIVEQVGHSFGRKIEVIAWIILKNDVLWRTVTEWVNNTDKLFIESLIMNHLFHSYSNKYHSDLLIFIAPFWHPKCADSSCSSRNLQIQSCIYFTPRIDAVTPPPPFSAFSRWRGLPAGCDRAN